MANEENLVAHQVQPGQVLNPNGRPKGIPNRKTILNFLLFEADIEEMEIFTNKPAWWDKVKPKTLYEMMVMARAIQAVKADSDGTAAFNALNKALGDVLDIHAEQDINVVHIYKPEKLDIEAFNEEGARLREHTRNVVEGELVDANTEPVASPSGSAGNSPQSTELSQ